MFSLGVTEILTALVVFALSYILMGYLSKKKNLPPGPIGFPILGCLLHIRKDPHLKLQEMAAKYGDVFSLYLGSLLVIVFNGVDAIKEGLNKPEFLGRPIKSAFTLANSPPSMFGINGKPYFEQRRFMLHSLRDLGFGKTVMEECMKDELQHFLKVLEDTGGRAHDVTTSLAPTVSNNITALIYGERYDYEDSRRKLLDNFLKVIQNFISQNAVHIFLPWTEKIPFLKQFLGYHRADFVVGKHLTFIRNRIDEHKKTLDPNNTRDYIDKFLLEMKLLQDKKVMDTTFTEEMLTANASALFGAGSGTVHTTLEWCLLLMAAYQKVQKKIQEEISNVIGSERMPVYSDQRQMPYTHSVILEITRLKTVVPLNVLRCALEDTTFRGYNIPKGTLILANLWSAHYDERYWKDPEKFLPERFLSADGKSVVKPEAFMPFSVGRRSCPGESMANVEVFTYFTSILQRFHIRLPEGVSPDLQGYVNITYHSKPQDLCFISRYSK